MMVRVSGEIRFAWDRIDRKATEDIARLAVAHVPDGRGTFLDLTVEENLPARPIIIRSGKCSAESSTVRIGSP